MNYLKNKIFLYCLAFLFGAFLICCPSRALAEKMIYQLRWSFIPAGEAVMETFADTQVQDENVNHFRLTARSFGHIDPFYKVRDQIDSYMDEQVTTTRLYTKKQREGKTKRDIRVVFDWNRYTARYENKGKAEAPITLLEGTVDPLGAYYFLRRQQLIPGESISRPVTDGKKVVMGKAHVLRREKISVPAGKFTTIVVEPDMKDVRGVYEKSKKARLLVWLRDDPSHLLIRARSKVVVGSFVAELIRYEP